MNWDKDWYVVFSDQGNGSALTKGFTNRTVLAEYLDVSYNTLTNHFVRDKEDYHVYPEKGVTVIRVKGIIPGKQRVQRHTGEHNRNI